MSPALQARRQSDAANTAFHVCLYTLFFQLAAHGYRYFTLAYTHDSTLIVQRTDTQWQISLGRFFQPVYWLLRGDIAAPFLIGLFSYVFLSLSILLIVRQLRIQSRLSILLICGVLTANVTVTSTNLTFVKDIDSYLCALFLGVAAIVLCAQLRYGFLLAVPCLIASLGLYQAYIQSAVLFAMLLLIDRLLRGETAGSVLLLGIKIVLTLLVSLLLYAAIWHAVLRFTHVIASETSNGLTSVGEYDGVSIPRLLLNTYLYPFEYALHPLTRYPRLSMLMSAFLLLFSLAGLLFLSLSLRLPLPGKLLLLLILLAMPFGMDLIYFISKGLEHDLMIYSFSLIYVLPILVFEHLRIRLGARLRCALRSILALCLSAMLLSNIVYANQAYLGRTLEYDNTASFAARILDRIEGTEGYLPGQTPVAIVGSTYDLLMSMQRPGFESFNELHNADNNFALTYPSTYGWYFSQIANYPILFCNGAVIEELKTRQDVIDMPIFPAAGSCVLKDGMLIVKLSTYYNAQ